uniref:Putative ovule protein n=1 Tax=Solanum chacoense TaxID=4108 RepID=A0A0V0HBW9_SOLCH
MIIEMSVSLLESKLCVFNNNEVTFNLWIMKEYDVQDSWIKLLTLPSNGDVSIIPIYSFSEGNVLLRYKYRDIEVIDRIFIETKVIYRTENRI